VLTQLSSAVGEQASQTWGFLKNIVNIDRFFSADDFDKENSEFEGESESDDAD
jgi:hypothetical protein